MEKYKPNFGDKRCQKRYWASIHWAIRFFGRGRRQIAARILEKKIGRISNPMTRYLHYYLLEVVDAHYSPVAHKAKKYRLNIQGVNYLRARLEGTYIGLFRDFALREDSTDKTWVHDQILKTHKMIVDEYRDQILTGTLDYRYQNNRFWHELQNIPKDTRRQELDRIGVKYHYDIQCCAPTLLYQYSRQLGFKKPTPVFDFMLEHKDIFRQELSDLCRVDGDQIKKIVLGILQGGRISPRLESHIYTNVLKYDIGAVYRLNREVLVIQLKKELYNMWLVIKKHHKWHKASPKNKSRIYRQLEEQVIRSIEKYLKIRSIGNLLIHDGWSQTQRLDILDIQDHIFNQTGFRVIVDEKL